MQEKLKTKTIDLKNKQLVVYCDFDGTIAKSDVADVLLEKLADPEWTTIEERWVKGEIDDCECMGQQIPLIRGNWAAVVNVLNTIELDSHFKSFVEQCKKNSFPIYIGSNGMDKVIDHFLSREGITVDGIWSYKLIESNNGWALEFPQGEPRGNCQVINAIACKCTLLEPSQSSSPQSADTYRIVIGDSRSDFCWANKADLVFAKPKLAKYCREQNINHIEFSSFADIQKHLNEYLN